MSKKFIISKSDRETTSVILDEYNFDYIKLLFVDEKSITRLNFNIVFLKQVRSINQSTNQKRNSMN